MPAPSSNRVEHSSRSTGRGALAAALLASFFVGCSNGSGGASDSGPAAPKGAGARAPDFAGRDVQGNTVRLSDHLGKEVILLNFWSTFCEPCMAEFPHMRRITAENKAKGFTTIAVSMDGPETVAQVPSFVKRNQLDTEFIVVYDEDSVIASLYNPKKAAPLSVVIDRSGAIRHIHEGYNPGDEEFLEKEIKALVDEAPKPL